jgi:hypothetical protein
MYGAIPCLSCKHWQYDFRCAAFDEIPDEIFLGQVSHDKPYPGDRGIQYEPDPQSAENKRKILAALGLAPQPKPPQ